MQPPAPASPLQSPAGAVPQPQQVNPVQVANIPPSVSPTPTHKNNKGLTGWVYAGVGLIMVVGVAAASWFFLYPSNSPVMGNVIISDQQVATSLFVRKLTIPGPKGGFLVIYKSDPSDTGNLFLTRTGYLFPGTYSDFRVKVINDIEEVVPSGTLMFAIIFEDTNGTKQWEDDGTDRIATDNNGETIRQAFRTTSEPLTE